MCVCESVCVARAHCVGQHSIDPRPGEAETNLRRSQTRGVISLLVHWSAMSSQLQTVISHTSITTTQHHQQQQ